MRLWSLHPRYLDTKGLVALWREGLLAQAVLQGRTRGYTQHPQLVRFREANNPKEAIADYLQVVHEEATRRGYQFDWRKIGRYGKNSGRTQTISVTKGQIQYEWNHLQAKLVKRAPHLIESMTTVRRIESHPVFRVVPGVKAEWEKIRL
jgi:hypothetical protein